MAENQYTEDNIRSLDWKEHIRLRPGMYIGKLGDGSQPEDGIYVLLKEVVDNCIDEHVMGFGKVMIIADSVDDNLWLSSRNLPNVYVVETHQADPWSLVKYGNVLITKAAVKQFEEMV
jgi:hypothetical protein